MTQNNLCHVFYSASLFYQYLSDQPPVRFIYLLRDEYSKENVKYSLFFVQLVNALNDIYTQTPSGLLGGVGVGIRLALSVIIRDDFIRRFKFLLPSNSLTSITFLCLC